MLAGLSSMIIFAFGLLGCINTCDIESSKKTGYVGTHEWRMERPTSAKVYNLSPGNQKTAVMTGDHLVVLLNLLVQKGVLTKRAPDPIDSNGYTPISYRVKFLHRDTEIGSMAVF